jgi:hypothetical protein
MGEGERGEEVMDRDYLRDKLEILEARDLEIAEFHAMQLPLAAALRRLLDEAAKLPPREPTSAMVQAGASSAYGPMYGARQAYDVIHVWRAMYDAAIRADAAQEPRPLMYEDELPDMSVADYDRWYAQSRIVDGVRMGPRITEPRE